MSYRLPHFDAKPLAPIATMAAFAKLPADTRMLWTLMATARVDNVRLTIYVPSPSPGIEYETL